MSETLRRARVLVASGDFVISRHGYRELDADGIVAADILTNIVRLSWLRTIRTRAKSRPF